MGLQLSWPSTLCSGFGIRHSSCHRVIIGLAISCSKIGQKPAKTKYLQNICANMKTTNNWAEVRMVSDFYIKFMPLSKLNRGKNGYLRSANNQQYQSRLGSQETMLLKEGTTPVM